MRRWPAAYYNSMRMMSRLAAVLLALGCVLTPSQWPVRAVAASPMHWMLSRYVLDAFRSDPAAAKVFSGAETFLIVQPEHDARVPAGWHSTPTVSYRSYAALEQAFADGSAPKAGAIMYDNEKWAFTPDNEKAEPAKYMQLAANLVHSHGLQFISTPAMALSSILRPGGGEIGDKYIALGIPRDAARFADVIDIQAQSLQFDVAAYTRIVTQAAQQARAANPHVIVIAGITTGRDRPDGSPATADDLLKVVQATRGVVDGYWLNVPAKGKDCPQCTDFRPELALDFLHRLDTSP